MKRKNLLKATIVGLSLAMLTACASGKEDKESVNSDITTETSTIVTDNETTEEKTSAEEETTAEKESATEEETTTEEETNAEKETSAEEETDGQEETTTQQKPTEAPTEKPTEAPTEKPTEAPTEKPTEAPTEKPTEAPTQKPTEVPTEKPTEAPTEKPTEAPTEKPTEAPTEKPTEAPTQKPTEVPTQKPVNKEVYQKAALEVLATDYHDYVGFMDINNDNIPELLFNNTITNSMVYEYKNGKYVLSETYTAFNPWDSQIYMDKSGNIIIFAVFNDGGVCFDGFVWFSLCNIELINLTGGENNHIGQMLHHDGYKKYYKDYEGFQFSAGGNSVNQEEFNQFMTDAVKDYKFIKNADEIYVKTTVEGENGNEIRKPDEQIVKEAYQIYTELNLK